MTYHEEDSPQIDRQKETKRGVPVVKAMGPSREMLVPSRGPITH